MPFGIRRPSAACSLINLSLHGQQGSHVVLADAIAAIHMSVLMMVWPHWEAVKRECSKWMPFGHLKVAFRALRFGSFVATPIDAVDPLHPKQIQNEQRIFASYSDGKRRSVSPHLLHAEMLQMGLIRSRDENPDQLAKLPDVLDFFDWINRYFIEE